MRAVIQRVTGASVRVNGTIVGEIKSGLLIFLGVSHGDTDADVERLVSKILKLRIFSDNQGKMNLSVKDIDGEILVVSQFTLLADCTHGNRPDFFGAAKPDLAEPLYESFKAKVAADGLRVACGIFGADMKISLVNDGPVTILLDTSILK